MKPPGTAGEVPDIVNLAKELRSAGDIRSGGILRAIDREDRAYELMVGTPGVMDLERKKQRRSGQGLDLVITEIALVKIQRRPAVELEQHISFSRRDPPFRSEHVPAAGAAVADPDRAAIEPDRRDFSALGRSIQTDDRFDEVRTIAGEPTGNRNASGMRRDSCDQRAAIDGQIVRQHEHAGEIVRGQRPADRLAVGAGVAGIRRALYHGPEGRRIEANRYGVHYVFDDFIAADLAVRRAAHQAGVGKFLAEFAIPCGAGKRFAAAKIKDKIGREPGLPWLPPIEGVPTQ